MTLTDTLPPMTGKAAAAKSFIADLARPFSIYVTSSAASWATVIIAQKVTSFAEAALFIGAVFTGVGALYGAKAVENIKASKHAAEVEVAKVNAAPAGGAQ